MPAKRGPRSRDAQDVPAARSLFESIVIRRRGAFWSSHIIQFYLRYALKSTLVFNAWLATAASIFRNPDCLGGRSQAFHREEEPIQSHLFYPHRPWDKHLYLGGIWPFIPDPLYRRSAVRLPRPYNARMSREDGPEVRLRSRRTGGEPAGRSRKRAA